MMLCSWDLNFFIILAYPEDGSSNTPETPVTNSQSTQRPIPEYCNFRQKRYENLTHVRSLTCEIGRSHGSD